MSHPRRSEVAPRVRAVLWDNDGVLVETEEAYYEANRDVLARAGVALSRERFVRMSLREGSGLSRLAREHGFGDQAVRKMLDARDALYAERLRGGVALRAGIRHALQRLHGRVPMAVVTTCPRDHFEIQHSASGLLGYFDFVLTREDYASSKPDPEPYLLAASRCRLPPQDCLAIEDSERGLASALAAGMRCLVVPSPMTRGGRFDGALAVHPDLARAMDAIEALLAGGPA